MSLSSIKRSYPCWRLLLRVIGEICTIRKDANVVYRTLNEATVMQRALWPGCAGNVEVESLLGMKTLGLSAFSIGIKAICARS